ncbi:MAG TPA: HEAT repeat domain-containing protein, partial [Planctomycetota bacterium]
LHVVALAASEASMRASRVPQASFAFLVILLTLALFPYTPVLAFPCALLVPLAAHAGYTAVWSRRREPLREKPRPRPAAVAVGLAFGLAALAFLAPAAAFGEDMTFRVALFRDRGLLGHPFGKAVSQAYYRTTLYTAWPLKEFFADTPGRPARAQRTAVSTPAAADALRALHFTLVPEGEGSAADVVVKPDRVDARGKHVNLSAETELRKALDLLSRETFRGSVLREANNLGWMAIYFAGPPAVVLLVIGLCCPFVSIMYRAMSAKAATIALAVCAATTLILMAVGNSAIGGMAASLDRLRKHPTPDGIRQALDHESVVFRHEGAVLAYQHPDPSFAEALLRASDDPDLRVRLWACAALGKTGHEKALPKLLSRLEDVELFVRYRAAEGLGHLKRREAIEPLRKVMREKSWYEGMYALEALRRIGP